jgi:peptidoglycan/xylan/chitin deacetylase (PgdA/CDA1 family)
MLLLLALACSRDSDHRRDPTRETSDPTDPGTDPTGGGETERRWDCSGITQADSSPLGGRIALTFDDGPNPATTPQVMAILEAYDIPATFFLLGDALSDPESWPIVEEMVASPLFDIGNHSWDHADFVGLTEDEARTEIDDTAALIETFGVTSTFFRFPYGDATCEMHDLATGKGYLVSGWHLDTVDWCYGDDGRCTQDDYWRIPRAARTTCSASRSSRRSGSTGAWCSCTTSTRPQRTRWRT